MTIVNFSERTKIFQHHFAHAFTGNPDFTHGDNAFEVLRGVNFVAAHGDRVRNHRDELSPNVVDNVDRGLSYSLSDVAEAHLQQTQIARRWLDLFKEIDVVICPATSTTPFNHDQWTITEIDGANGNLHALASHYLFTNHGACVRCCNPVWCR